MVLAKYKKPLLMGLIGVAGCAVIGLIVPVGWMDMLTKILIMMLFATSINIMFGYGGIIAFGAGNLFRPRGILIHYICRKDGHTGFCFRAARNRFYHRSQPYNRQAMSSRTIADARASFPRHQYAFL